MARLSKWLLVGTVVAGTIGCASTYWKGYQEGGVKYSDITYNYIAKPVLNSSCKSYKITTDAALSQIRSIRALEKKGIRKTTGDADVSFTLSSGEITHEPAGFGLSKSFKPAVSSKMFITVEVADKNGNTVLNRTVKHEEILTIKGAKEYPTREEAKSAMTSISDLIKSGADAKVRSGAPATVNKSLTRISKDLYENRKVSVTLPAFRKAGEVDMEEAYTLLSKAKSDAQVKAALQSYTALGVGHKKPDGSHDIVGNYGVYCGMASAKILSGDLGGAWEDTKSAWRLFPKGEEYRKIAQVLRQQEQQTGTSIINDDEYKEMVGSVDNKAAESLQNMFNRMK